MNKWTILSLVVLSVAVAARSADADPVECPARPGKQARARNLAGSFFARGETAGRDGRFEEAVDSFLCSLKMAPHENTVFNLAQLSKLVDDKQLVLERLERFVKENPDSASVEGVQELIRDLEKTLGVEGADVPPPPEEPAEEPAPAAEPGAGEAAPGDAAPGPEAEPGALRIAGWSVLGAGGAGLIVGAILQGVAAGRKDDALDTTLYDDFQAREEEWRRAQNGAIAFFVVGGALAATGAVLLAVAGRRESEATASVEIGLGTTGNGIAIDGSF